MSISASPPEPQTTDAVLLIRPQRFYGNPQTAASNPYQVGTTSSPEAVHAQALREQAGLQALLETAGVAVTVLDAPPEPETPDALFPNNWFSSHADGTLVLYPMAVANRRAERRPAFIAALRQQLGCTRLVDLSPHEQAGRFLEGTGSLVLDRPLRVAYAALSLRTDAAAAADFARQLGYRLRLFTTRPRRGQPVYHTNVVMSVGATAAVVCLEAIASPAEQAAVQAELSASGHEIVAIAGEQLDAFAANLLQLRSRRGEPFWVLSSRAYEALNRDQRERLARHGPLLHTPLSTIEAVGGGSARCLMAELFVPRSSAQAQ